MVGPKPHIPRELTQRPFSLEDARAAGLSRTSLSGRSWRRLGARLYCGSGLVDDPWQLLSAWLRVLPEGAVFSRSTAAWLHGSSSVHDPVFVPAQVSPFAVLTSRDAMS